MKLIKLSADHYIIVDDSEIKEGDTCFHLVTKNITQQYNNSCYGDWKKITHSTQPLESVPLYKMPNGELIDEIWYNKIQQLSLSEVKELLGEVDVEALETRYYQQLEQRREVAKNFTGQVAGRHPDMFASNEVHNMVRGYIEGYNQAIEDNKDRKYTEIDLRAVFMHGFLLGVDRGDYSLDMENRALSTYTQPPTQWDVEFVDGKLKLV